MFRVLKVVVNMKFNGGYRGVFKIRRRLSVFNRFILLKVGGFLSNYVVIRNLGF